MGRKDKWFDTVQKILSSSEPADPVETEAGKKVAKPRFKKLWQLTKPSNASTSTAPWAHQHQPPPPPSLSRPDRKQGEAITAEAQILDAWREQVDQHVCTAAEASDSEQAAVESETVAGPTDTAPRALPARSKEDIAATRIQAACRSHLARRAQRERAMARLMSLVEGGLAVKRQTEEALYCMQTMTRVQTQIYSRRLKTEEDKKALKSQIKIEQSFDKAKIGEGWDHGHQSKEQMEAVLTMKREAASRRQKALAYAFSHQWRNRNPSSARAAPPPMFMDPGNPNWGWTWTERWMAAARPWETQTTAPGNSRATAKSAGGRPRLAAISVQTPSTPGGRSFRPPNWPSLPSPSTPPLRSPSVSGRTIVSPSSRSSTLHAAGGPQLDRRPRSSQQERVVAASSPRCVVPASPRRSGSPLHASGGGLQRTTSVQLERRPRSSQKERSVAASSPRCVVPASPRRSGSPLHASGGGLQRTTSMQLERRPRSSQQERAVAASSPRCAVPASPRRSGSPLHASGGGLQRTTSMQLERRPRSSQDREASSPRHAGTTSALLRTTSLGTGGAAPAENAGAPVTPRYMLPTTSVRAKARCPSPSPSTSPTKPDAAERAPAPLHESSPSSVKKRPSLGIADKPNPTSTP